MCTELKTHIRLVSIVWLFYFVEYNYFDASVPYVLVLFLDGLCCVDSFANCTMYITNGIYFEIISVNITSKKQKPVEMQIRVFSNWNKVVRSCLIWYYTLVLVGKCYHLSRNVLVKHFKTEEIWQKVFFIFLPIWVRTWCNGIAKEKSDNRSTHFEI